MALVDFLQAGQAFLEGIALIASPCILPVLPIILAGSLDSGRRRPFGIIVGFIFSFVAFALLARQLLLILHADPVIIRNVALGLLIALGLIMLSKKLSDMLFGTTQGLANFGQRLSSKWDQKHGFLDGFAIGALVGLIWSPCAGPIMAAAIVQIIQAKSGSNVAVTVLMFAIGAALPMLLIAIAGRRIMSHFDFLKNHSTAVRRGLGIVILLSAFLIYKGVDVAILGASNVASTSTNSLKSINEGTHLRMGLDHPYPAPEIAVGGSWINSEPLKVSELKGKVVLIDFWTYSCINCVRTLPIMTSLDEKYRDKGLVIIGVHSPEFEFEKKLENVKAATTRFGIKYPVVQDNDLATWSAFKNSYWPAHYLIDKSGQVVYTHFGEGEDDITEHNIRVLLGLNGEAANALTPQNNLPHLPGMQTPETYLGYERAANFAGEGAPPHDVASQYTFPSPLLLNEWGLSGEWSSTEEYIESTKPTAGLRLNFMARKVFLVMGTITGDPIKVKIMLNGKPVTKVSAGSDVKDGTLTVDSERLYELIDQGTSKNGILDLEVQSVGLQAYAVTFGN